MARIILVKFNGAYSYEKYAVCKKTIFGCEYLSRSSGLWWSYRDSVMSYCRMSKEEAHRLFESTTGKKLEDTY